MALLRLPSGSGSSCTRCRRCSWTVSTRSALFSIASPDLIVNKVPALVAIADAVRSTIFECCHAGDHRVGSREDCRGDGWKLLWRVCWRCSSSCPWISGRPGELALHYGIALLTAVGAVLFCKKFARSNYLAYALVLWALSFRGPLGELFGTSIPAMHVQGWIVVAVLAASVVWAVLPAMTGKAEVKAQAA